VTSDKWNDEKSMIPYLKTMDQFLDHKVKIILGGVVCIQFLKFKYINEIEIISHFEKFDEGLKNRSITLS
jgi:hypothetical protein